MGSLFRPDDREEQRATWLELFLDLVYVFAVTQISHLLLDHPTLRGALQAGFVLLVVWWAWIYTTWMANWFDPDAVPVRLVLIGVMAASLLLGVAIPGAFGDDALLFAGAYVALQVGRNVFVVAVTRDNLPLRPAFERILAWSLFSAPLWLAGGLLDGGPRLGLWLVALALDYAGPALGYRTPRLGRSETGDWSIDGAHFAERFQLFVIIALGESIVVSGATASALGVSPAVAGALIVAFFGSAALWWLYFDLVAGRASARLIEADDRGRLGRDAYTYAHIPIVAGIVVSAVGDELLIAHPGGEAHAIGALTIAGGAALYLAGHLCFRRLMGVRTVSRPRLLATAALLVLAAVGAPLPTIAVATITVGVLVALVALETRRRFHGGRL